MSVHSLCDRVGKWVKDLPILSSLINDASIINKYWDAAQNSWKKASSNDILLHVTVLLYHLMQEQQRCLSRFGVDFSHATEKLLRFISECLLGVENAASFLSFGEYESVGDLFTAFFSIIQTLSTVKTECDGAYFSCSNAWAFVKHLTQYRVTTVACHAGTKVQNVCKMANDLLCSQINRLTMNFMDNAERIILAMFDVCNNELLLTSWPTSPKVSCLLTYILEFADQFLDYVASLTALDFEMEFELGWIEIEDEDFVPVDSVTSRKNKRQIGQH